MGRAHMSAARFGFTARSHAPPLFPVSALNARRALGAGGHLSSSPTWVGPPISLFRTSPRKPSPTLVLPSHHSAVLLAALLCAGCCFTHRCPSPMSHPELSSRAKRSASSPCPSCTKSLPAAPAGEAGTQDFPVVIFLCEHHTSGSLLRLFPHPADPTANSALPRSSSPNSSLATSTTPSAPQRRPLPIGTCTTAESPPPQ
jgi:hypothetical protein